YGSVSHRFIRCSTGWKRGGGFAVAGWKRPGNAGADIIDLRAREKRSWPRSAMDGANLWKRLGESPELNMPDFKAEIRQSIAELNLPLEREAEIVEELSQDLEERFEKALRDGASEEQAKQLALEELVQPDSLSAQLKRLKIPLRQPPLTIGAN